MVPGPGPVSFEIHNCSSCLDYYDAIFSYSNVPLISIGTLRLHIYLLSAICSGVVSILTNMSLWRQLLKSVAKKW